MHFVEAGSHSVLSCGGHSSKCRTSQLVFRSIQRACNIKKVCGLSRRVFLHSASSP
ncbi:hypothetical protein VITFI_CDS0221 [Vitreoscilla filiformis]|uniref:Uncharacterized protein n=1 Tax=Vitreoscilla filiformis TaxID=63 RepID=A0A221KAY4_VITFI|nr:hypothetical protein VITFI_CDS0221 [Vitreoscilla filiformis]